MSEWVFWVAAVVLVVAFVLPRRWLHLIGLLGMGVMTYRAVSFGPDWPMAYLNGACCVVHCGMLYRIWVLRAGPGG